MTRRRRLRVVAIAAGTVGLASLARADAPGDQYGLFDANNTTIVDVRTGLVWQRSAPSQTFDFLGAAAYCDALSLATYPSGWRVPSYKELMTLVDESPHTEYESGKLVSKAIDGNAFPQTSVTSQYWTSSPFPPSPGYGYIVNFGDGHSAGDSTGISHYVRCVR